MKYSAVIEVGKGQTRRFVKATHCGIHKIKDYGKPFAWNYGFIKDTLSTDGDELDILVFGRKLKPFDCVKVKPKYVIFTTENGVIDNKILAGRVRKKDLRNALAVFIGNPTRLVQGIGDAKDAWDLIRKETIKKGEK